MIKNRIMLADSYKYSHIEQYPKKIYSMYDYAEARSGKVYDKTVFFGLQYILLEYFKKPISMVEVEQAEKFAQAHGITFYADDWKYIVNKHNGHIPVVIKAVPEGKVIPVNNVLFTIESTDPKVFWITSWMETILMKVWYPSNVATRSYYIRKMLEGYAKETSDVENVDYQFHNFGDRGSSSVESAAIGGMAHLTQFRGTDNFNSVLQTYEFYGNDFNSGVIDDDNITCKVEEPIDINTIGHSIPATEHSTTTSWGDVNEMEMIMNHLEINKGKPIIAAVCDSYDYNKCVENITKPQGVFQEKINSDEYPIFVIRPDSGKPEIVINDTLDIMERNMVPYTVNSKGYKVFNKMRIIWGDGVNQDTIKIMLDILKDRKYSSDNIAFGSGGWLMQQHDRDTQGWAIKCSNIKIKDGNKLYNFDVFKDPITDTKKKSKKGRVSLFIDTKTGEYVNYVMIENEIPEGYERVLETVYENGKITKIYSIDDIRKNSGN